MKIEFGHVLIFIVCFYLIKAYYLAVFLRKTENCFVHLSSTVHELKSTMLYISPLLYYFYCRIFRPRFSTNPSSHCI